MKTFTRKNRSIPIRYNPKSLTHKDRKKQYNMINKSRRLYKKGIYYTRKKVKSFKSKVSSHILRAKKIFHVNKIGATKELSKRTGCSVSALSNIIRKGQGAYYSSGSRPNQTAHSWGVARLASAITAGKAALVDYDIIKTGCRKSGKTRKLVYKKYNK